MARIDHLDEEPRQALQLAAVIGREFTQRLLDRIAEIRRGTTPILRELQAIELIYEKALFPELAYMFKHALTQDVAYRSLLRSGDANCIGGSARRSRSCTRTVSRSTTPYSPTTSRAARTGLGLRPTSRKPRTAQQRLSPCLEALTLYDQAIEALDRGGGGEAALVRRATCAPEGRPVHVAQRFRAGSCRACQSRDDRPSAG